MRQKLIYGLRATLAGCCVFIVSAGYALARTDVGMCPVMPGRLAKSNLSIEYAGAKYYVCCASCVRQFKRNPEKYIQ